MLTLSPRQLLFLSLIAAFATMALKGVAWHLTGSVGFLSDALESLVNVAGAGFALFMVTLAQRPADDNHPYGHSKAEYLSAAFEGGMILLAAIAVHVIAAVWHSLRVHNVIAVMITGKDTQSKNDAGSEPVSGFVHSGWFFLIVALLLVGFYFWQGQSLVGYL